MLWNGIDIHWYTSSLISVKVERFSSFFFKATSLYTDIRGEELVDRNLKYAKEALIWLWPPPTSGQLLTWKLGRQFFLHIQAAGCPSFYAVACCWKETLFFSVSKRSTEFLLLCWLSSKKQKKKLIWRVRKQNRHYGFQSWKYVSTRDGRWSLGIQSYFEGVQDE